MKTLVAVVAVLALGGCAARTTPARTLSSPAASPPTPAAVTPQPTQRVVSYPEGRYVLYGGGTAFDPYYWVWIPAGAVTPGPPPSPPR